MIYRCDLQHFLTHAIDYFTLPELRNFQYVVISSKISSNGRAQNVIKQPDLYPDVETIMAYSDSGDKDILEKLYIGMLNPNDKTFNGHKQESNPYSNVIYRTFINPLLEHYDEMIICDKDENDYIDILCKYLKKEFGIEVIDLNELFSKGRIGPIYIDRDDIHDKAVDIRRAAIKEEIKNMASTRDGKEKLISKMSKKEKVKQLKRYGIRLNEREMKDIDEILLDEWCEEDGTSNNN